MTTETNIIARRKALEPMLLRIMSTPQGQADLAALISEFCDELRLLGLQADARAERERCRCCICTEHLADSAKMLNEARASVQA